VFRRNLWQAVLTLERETQVAQRHIQVFGHCSEIASYASHEVARISADAVAARGVFSIALAGGSTPKMLYALMAEHPTLRYSLPWDKMQVFFGDERHVGPGHADSNFQMATDAMLSKVPLQPQQIHRIRAKMRTLRRLLPNTKTKLAASSA
jgi:6-phosphogluconolactonase